MIHYVHRIISFHTCAVQAAVYRGSTTAENRRKPQIYGREAREVTVLTAIRMLTFCNLLQDKNVVEPQCNAT